MARGNRTWCYVGVSDFGYWTVVFFCLLLPFLVCPAFGGRKGEKPRIVRPPDSVATIVGQSVLFVCLVEGNPAPKVQWKVSGADVSDVHFGKTVRATRGSVLRATNVLPNYNGALITCTATNALGLAEASASLTVYADESAAPVGYPRFLNSFSVIVAKKNAGVELECRASGSPQPLITWYKESVPVDMGNPRFSQLPEGNLRVTRLIEDDEGKYECAATNSKGTRLSSGDNLLVRAKRFRPHFTNVPASRQIVPPGGRLSVSCTAVGAPVPVVDWYKGSRRLPGEHADKQSPGTARILLVDLSESINITCVAESSMGRTYHDVHVLVKNLPAAPKRPYLLELGFAHARLAFAPANPINMTGIKHFMLFWSPSRLLDNQTLHATPDPIGGIRASPTSSLASTSVSGTTSSHGSGGGGGGGSIDAATSIESGIYKVRPSMSLHAIDLTNVTRTVGERVKIIDSGRTLTASEATHQFGAIVASITKLKPATDYTVWARAVGPDRDASVPGPILSFTTQEIAPSSAPRHVQAEAISNAAVTVYWDPPGEPNGRIRAYRVHYTDRRPTLELAFWDTSIVDVDPNREPESRGPSPSGSTRTHHHLYILSHLTANSTYWIRVSAVNAKGEGPASDHVVVIVRPGLLSKPRNLTAESKSSHEIQLTWQPPEGTDQSNRLLRHYTLEYVPVEARHTGSLEWAELLEGNGASGPVYTDPVGASLTSLVINRLKSDTQYLFRLASVTTSGAGVRAIAYARTEKFVPGEPSNLTVEVLSSTELRVQWQPPIDRIAWSSSGGTANETGMVRIAYYDLSWRPSTVKGDWLRSSDAGSNGVVSSPWSSTHLASMDTSHASGNGFSRRLVPARAQGHGVANQQLWYTASLTGLQPATYYVIHIRTVGPSGSGDRAVAGPMRTWNPPPDAPRKLHLFSQILPPTGVSLPPQVSIRVAWQPAPAKQPTSTLDTYRVRWRLLPGSTSAPSHHGSIIRYKRVAERSVERWLFWLPVTKSDGSTGGLIPTQLLSGEMNTSETSWSPLPGQFLLGMTYEFRVAVLTATQAGQEAVQLIALEGSAPTASPADVTILSRADNDDPSLQWSPPDWSHRHGPFMTYEVQCDWPTSESQSNAGTINMTMTNSQVEWPQDRPSRGTDQLLAWPSGRLKWSIEGKLTKQSETRCTIRAWNKYGHGPWSKPVVVTETEINGDIAATQPPPPPKGIRALLLPDANLRVSWAMPEGLEQSVVSSIDTLSNQTAQRITNQLLYRQFAVYISPLAEKRWSRFLTDGPTTELIVPSQQPTIRFEASQVRVSSISGSGHEGIWSDTVRTEQPRRAMSVSNLTCTAVRFDASHGVWTAQLQWTAPTLVARFGAQTLSHYRVNFSKNTAEREQSASVNSGGARILNVQHLLTALQPNSHYRISVRPVLTTSHLEEIKDWYGVAKDTSCSIPKRAMLMVQSPGVLQVRPDAIIVQCTAFAETTIPNSILTSEPIIFELIGQLLDTMTTATAPTGSDIIQLARWTTAPSDSIGRFEVVVSTNEVRSSSPQLGRKIFGFGLVAGKRYALALQVCVKIPTDGQQSVNTRTPSTCYQSAWVQPVATNLPIPPITSESKSINPPASVSDPDAVIWSHHEKTTSSSTSHRPPADDAAALDSSGWLSNSHGKRQSDASATDKLPPSQLQPSHESSKNDIQPADGIPLDTEKHPKATSGSVQTAHTSMWATLVTCVILLVLGLVGFLAVLVCRRRDRHRGNPATPTGCNGGGKPAWIVGQPMEVEGHQPASMFRSLIRGRGPKRNIPRGMSVPLDWGGHQTCRQALITDAETMTANTTPGSLVGGAGRLNGDCVAGYLPPFESPIRQFSSTDGGSSNGTLRLNGLRLPRVDSTPLGVHSTPRNGIYNPLRMTSDLEAVGNSLRSINTTSHLSGGFAATLASERSARAAPTGGPIGMTQLAEHVRALKADNRRLVSAEFESIDPGGPFTWEHSNRAVNRAKNRYANVISYDHTRVVLQPTSSTDPDSDYINANYLDGYRKQNAYIATQGPLPNTVIHFWRMVWEQRSAIVVSMTRLEEKTRVKCEQYWPVGGNLAGAARTASPSPGRFPQLSSDVSSAWPTLPLNGVGGTSPHRLSPDEVNSVRLTNKKGLLPSCNLTEENGWAAGAELLGEVTYGDITVGLVDMMQLAYYTIRTLVLHKAGSSERREVRQLQFTAWPDHGVPSHPAPLLMFLRRVRSECPTDSGPIVVHCSAGVGRTGAFILLDILLEQMRFEKAVDVFGAVSRLRAQRNFMVQTDDQYAFVYEALVEVAASGNTELTVSQLAAHWNRLTAANNCSNDDRDDGIGRTGLELEFSQLVAQTPSRSLDRQASRLSCDTISVPVDDDRSVVSKRTPRLPSVSYDPGDWAITANSRANLTKNRNMEVIPHDANRVLLKAIRGVDGSDYINASYIDGYRSRAAYIVTQSPLSATVDDFWRMIWESGCCLIVRLQSIPSDDDPKSTDAPPYWPTGVQSTRHGFLIVDPISTYTMPSYVMRELRLTDTRDGTSRTVRQFDASPTTNAMAEFDMKDGAGGVVSVQRLPSAACARIGRHFRERHQAMCEAMLEVVIQVHKTKEHFGMDGPITVHCNLGTGRTGVFLAVALVLERMRYEGVVDMFQTVKLLRWQRPNLVRAATEYAFCYATALEYLESFERYVS